MVGMVDWISMGRIRQECRIEGCTHMGQSMGNFGGSPKYFTICKSHRKMKRNERVMAAKLPRGAYELDLLETVAPYKKKAEENKMKFINGFPPNIEEIKKHFMIHDGVIFTYGDAIYCQGNFNLSEDLVVHEQVHMRQQKDDPEKWWNRYLSDVQFRVDQEAAAYKEQWKFLQKGHNRNQLYSILNHLASDFSGEMYGSCVSYKKALQLIKS